MKVHVAIGDQRILVILVDAQRFLEAFLSLGEFFSPEMKVAEGNDGTDVLGIQCRGLVQKRRCLFEVAGLRFDGRQS